MKSRTIRIFVSSTFTDMKADRDVLQRDVFPRLHRLCSDRGLRFQAIDLRWGVSQEASNDNRTMRVCMRELRRCLSGSTKPNFLILLGDRYGWRPLPELLPADFIERLKRFIPESMLQMLGVSENSETEGWYRLDDNAIPPVYELRPRGSVANWERSIEAPLLGALKNAAKECGLTEEAKALSIGVSATEQEIIAGAFSASNAPEHVHAFFRIGSASIGAGLSQTSIVDPNPSTETELLDLLQALKKRITEHLGDANVHPYSITNEDGNVSPEALEDFGRQVFDALAPVVLRQATALERELETESEEVQHTDFCHKQGGEPPLRADELIWVQDHLERREPRALAILGRVGSGKSTLLAQAADRARHAYGDEAVLARFIGLTPSSAHLQGLLRDLIGQIRKRYPKSASAESSAAEIALPYDTPSLVKMFRECLLRPNDQQPLFLFLDALDALSPTDGSQSLYWLPLAENPAVRLVISAEEWEETNDKTGKPSPAQTLMNRPEVDVRRLRLLTRTEGQFLIRLWMARAGRRLQSTQEDVVLDAFEQGGNPLWLAIAARESARLASWDAPAHWNGSLIGLISQVLTGLTGKARHGCTFVEHVLRYVSCARDGLAEDELIELLSNDPDVMDDFRCRNPKSPAVKVLPAAVWVALLGDLESYLVESDTQGSELMRFRHALFRDCVNSFVSLSAEVGHRQLAAYFGSQFRDLGTQAGRALRELPFQQARSGMWDEVFETLTSPAFLEGRFGEHVFAGGPSATEQLHSLIREFETAAKEMP